MPAETSRKVLNPPGGFRSAQTAALQRLVLRGLLLLVGALVPHLEHRRDALAPLAVRSAWAVRADRVVLFAFSTLAHQLVSLVMHEHHHASGDQQNRYNFACVHVAPLWIVNW